MDKPRKTQKKETVPNGRPTILDLARHAGVSIATVSRALNTPDVVSDDMRRKVEASVAELGYVTSSVGKALRKQRTRVIGTLLPQLDNPLFSVFAAGVHSALSEAGLNDRVSDCMAGRMVDRLTIEQLKKLERLKTRAAERDPVTIRDYLSRVARVGDAEVIGVTSSSAALCATGIAD